MKPNSTPSVLQRFGRGLLGLGIGWALSSVVGLLWCGVGIIYYGDLDEALAKVKFEPFGPAVFGGVLGGMMGAWIAAGVGPAALGPNRLRRPVLVTAVIAGGLSALVTTGVGMTTADAIADRLPRSKWIVLIPMILGVVGGTLTGWRVGSRLTKPLSPGADHVGHTPSEEYDDS